MTMETDQCGTQQLLRLADLPLPWQLQSYAIQIGVMAESFLTS